jgi:hypothetical protein
MDSRWHLPPGILFVLSDEISLKLEALMLASG